MTTEPRSRAERRRDTEHRLNDDTDVWVATSSADGVPHLVPLSFVWDGKALLVATPRDRVTGRHLAESNIAQLGLGHTRDVTIIEGVVEVFEMDELPHGLAQRYVARAGRHPCAESTLCRWCCIAPRRIRGWRDVNELPGRVLMRERTWLACERDLDGRSGEWRSIA